LNPEQQAPEQLHTPNAQPLPEKPAKIHNKKRLIFLIIFIVVFVALAVWYFLLRSKTTITPILQSTTETSKVSEPVKAEKWQNFVVDQDNLAKKANFKESELGDSGVVVFNDKVRRYVVLPALSEQSFSGEFSSKDTTNPIKRDEVFDSFKAWFRENSFDEYTPKDPDLKARLENFKSEQFKKADIICELQMDFGDGIVSYNTFRICSDTSKLDAVTSDLMPFIKAYEAGEDYQKYLLSAGEAQAIKYILSANKSDVKQSEFSGYEYLYGGYSGVEGSGGARLAFYRKAGGDWIFAYGTQAVLSCEDTYTNIDIKKALAHDSCSSNDSPDQVTTVKEFFKL
jgi:hypothetical protein